jgi:hypothetical protein
LKPCFLFISSRGFDRIKVILRWIFGSHIDSEFQGRNLFCGYVGVLRYCYTFCPSSHAGYVEKHPTDLACLVYDNGQPLMMSFLPEDIFVLKSDQLATDVVPGVADDRFCGNVTTTQPFVYCLDKCNMDRPVTVINK